MLEKWKDRLIMLKYVLVFWLAVSLVSGLFNSLVGVSYIKAANLTTKESLEYIALVFLMGSLGLGSLIGLSLWLYLVITERKTPEIMHSMVGELGGLWQTLTTKRKGEKR